MIAVAAPVVEHEAIGQVEPLELAELEAAEQQPLSVELRDSQREPVGHYDQTMPVAGQPADAGRFRSPLLTHPVIAPTLLRLRRTILKQYLSPITFLPIGTIAAPPLAIHHLTTALSVAVASIHSKPN